MNLRQQFSHAHPDAFFLDGADLQTLAEYLAMKGRLNECEMVLSTEKPGEGNMNYVRRVKTNQRTFILKQARPWVEKYPQIAAPVERVGVEAKFFQVVDSIEGIRDFSPKPLWHEQDDFLLALEDLGAGADFSFLYQKGENLSEKEADYLVGYLSALHNWDTDALAEEFPLNMSMRRLNHEHIFHFPYLMDNGFDLDTIQKGLQEVSAKYKQDEELKEKVAELGEVYLSPGDILLHGDFYPGSWLKVDAGIRIIDPEFGFTGYAEFDLGVFLANMLMAQQPDSVLRRILNSYQAPEGFDDLLLAGFTATEILRRIIGLAQLPLSLSLEEKQSLLEKAAEAVKTGSLKALISLS